MIFYEDIFSELGKEKIKFVVVGGVALALHGVVRLTMDLDMMVAFDDENMEAFGKVMKKLGYYPKAPVPVKDLASPKKRKEWIENKNMKVFSFQHDKEMHKIIDVFIIEPIPFKLVFRDKKIVKAGSLKIPICSKKHLIQLKEKAARPQDLKDISALKKLRS